MAQRAQATGDNPIAAIIAGNLRRLRAGGELSIGELARRSGLSKSTVSALEAGTANPNMETLWAIAVALGIPFGQLMADTPAAVQVIRAASGGRVGSERDTSSSVRVLASTAQRSARDIVVLDAEPGGRRSAEPHISGTVEHTYVVRGTMRVGPIDGEVTLSEGDYAVFTADVPHSYEALAPTTRIVTILEYP